MPLQASWTNTVKKRCVIINAKNFKYGMALHDDVFPFHRKVLSRRWKDGCMDGLMDVVSA